MGTARAQGATMLATIALILVDFCVKPSRLLMKWLQSPTSTTSIDARAAPPPVLYRQ